MFGESVEIQSRRRGAYRALISACVRIAAKHQPGGTFINSSRLELLSDWNNGGQHCFQAGIRRGPDSTKNHPDELQSGSAQKAASRGLLLWFVRILWRERRQARSGRWSVGIGWFFRW